MEETVKRQETSQDKLKKAKGRLERKLEVVRKNIDSVVLFYNQGDTYTRIRDMDKILKVLKKRIISQKITMEELSQVIKQYESVIINLWNCLAQVYSAISGYTPESWRALNDSFQEKQMLCYRQNTFVYEPRSDQAGQALILLKNIGKAYLYYQNHPGNDSYQKLQELSLIEQRMRHTLDELNKTMMQNYNISF